MAYNISSAAQQIRNWIESTPDKTLLTTTHDRKCCDSMGAVMGFAHYASTFGKDVCCIFARPHSQPMSERLYKEIVAPKSIMVSGEKLEDRLEKRIAPHTALFVLDTSSMQNSTYLPVIVSMKPLKLYCIDHHEAGFEDISYIANSEVIRIEDAQATSTIITHVLNENNALPEDQATLIALYTGIYQDTIMIQREQYSPLTTNAFSLLEERLNPGSKQHINDLKATPYPPVWQRYLKSASSCPVKDDCIVVGLGIVDNPGIVAYVADKLLAAGKSSTVIAIALAQEKISKRLYLDLVASGRSKDSLAEQLPAIFGNVFTVETKEGIVSKGGGKITGNLASCAACIPLSSVADAQKLWHNEIQKIKENLIAYNIPEECMTFNNGKI